MTNNTSSINGKAFEYACLLALRNLLGAAYEEIESSAIAVAMNCYNGLPAKKREIMSKSAIAGVKKIIELEPHMNQASVESKIKCGIQKDKKGEHGDVRDVICIGIGEDWETGVSCKHNNFAVKHNRLSDTIDFGALWLSHPCSDVYMNEVKRIFGLARNYRQEGKTWKSLGEDKEDEFYVPVLEAFKKELSQLAKTYPDTPERFVKYMLGDFDFYKLIGIDSQQKATITAYNLNGTLGLPFAGVSSRERPRKLKLPTEIESIKFVKGKKNTIIVLFDEGWSLSMRIHSASTIVEPSLKFDVQLVGNPSTMENFSCKW